MDNLPPDQLGGHAPQPRYCFIIKRPDFSGYGFNLHAEKSRPGQFIGKVDENSPAEIAGLREGDRIVEVNGINISQENHKQVVQRIKAVPNETKLLVVDKIADEYYKKINVMVKSSMPNVLVRSSEDEAISSSGKPEVNGNNNNNNFQEAVVPVVSSEKNMEDIINNAGVQDTSDGGHHHRIKTSPSSRSSSSSVEKKPMSLTSDDGSSTRTTPSPVPLNRSDSDRTDWDGLNLSLTAREMRERIGSRKKSDPRREKLDMRKKYEIIQTL